MPLRFHRVHSERVHQQVVSSAGGERPHVYPQSMNDGILVVTLVSLARSFVVRGWRGSLRESVGK